MNLPLKLRAPEIAGLSVLGATIGALLCGAGVAGLSPLTLVGALAGAVAPVLVAAAARRPGNEGER